MIRVLLLADTHLGFDDPVRPRVERRRRGPDFFANTRRALEPALEGKVDLVVHGGDLLYRSKVRAALVAAALEPLLEVCDLGTPVMLVPGNHERSSLPFPLLASHEKLHVFDRPRAFELEINGARVVVAGFPCERNGIRDRFNQLVSTAEGVEGRADLRLLCVHQTFEGARVKGYTFRGDADVVRGQDVPGGFAAVLSGHIHRHQILTHDLGGCQLPAPVLYPGSVERTSLAERDEAKGYVTLDFERESGDGGFLASHRFHELPTRPMCVLTINASGLVPEAFERRLRDSLEELPVDSVVSLRIEGQLEPGAEVVVRAARLRQLHPPTMTVELRFRRT